MPTSRAETFINALRRLESEGDLETIAGLFGDEAEVSNPADAAPHVGRDGARAFWSKYRDAFDRVRSDFRNVVESDRAALLEWRSDGRTASGHDFSYDGASVLEYTGDRIVRFRAYYDPHALTAGAARKEVAKSLTPTAGDASTAPRAEPRA